MRNTNFLDGQIINITIAQLLREIRRKKTNIRHKASGENYTVIALLSDIEMRKPNTGFLIKFMYKLTIKAKATFWLKI